MINSKLLALGAVIVNVGTSSILSSSQIETCLESSGENSGSIDGITCQEKLVILLSIDSN